jgi:hypothetical protein
MTSRSDTMCSSILSASPMTRKRNLLRLELPESHRCAVTPLDKASLRATKTLATLIIRGPCFLIHTGANGALNDLDYL